MMQPKRRSWIAWLCAVSFVATPPLASAAQELYNPVWAADLGWTNSNLFNRPAGSNAYWENEYQPWWQTRVAHPILDYSGSKLPAGAIRLDGALEFDYTMHRALKGWDKNTSPSGINNVYDFTPGSTSQEDRTARAGQTAFIDFAAHPTTALSADIGAEFVGNYDQRYWFPVNDEHRMFNDDKHAKIVRGEIKYDTGNFMLRGFEGVPQYNWLGQNDLFSLLPSQIDTEYYRAESGSLTPRGGELRWKSVLGTIDVIGGTETRWAYGSGVYAKYDLPVFRSLEQSVVYRNENIPFGLQDPDERRWTLSYNASYPWTERITSHAGVLYQPFRLDTPYQDPGSTNAAGVPETRDTKRTDALGFTTRTEVQPTSVVNEVGLGYTYLGPVAGDKHQVEGDVSKTVGPLNVTAAYIYRQPVVGPVPLLFEGTPNNAGALLASPRGPDDPFWVQWDNRKAHLFALTLVYDPTPGTPFFKYQKNILEDWNINPDEDATWLAAAQYRLTDYLTNTDRSYYWDENRQLHWDPIFHSGAYASDHPLSSFTTLVRWKPNEWRFTADCSAGESMAGLGLAYTTATDFYKPTTFYLSAGAGASNGLLNLFFRYGQDVWGPIDYHIQNGWTYHRLYEAGLSYNFLRDFQAGFRFIGTRMTEQFIGSDTGAFNEYTLFLTYHFGIEHNFGNKIAAIGRAIPQTLPESSVTLSDSRFSPGGENGPREISILPHASADTGILSWKIFIRNNGGDTVRQWEGSGKPPANVRWDGLGNDTRPLPAGTYRVTLTAVDLYGNEVTSPAQPVDIQSNTPPASSLPSAPAAASEIAPAPASTNAKAYSVRQTSEGLKVTLSSMILFDVDQSTLKGIAQQSIQQIHELLKAYPRNTLRVVGYSDSLGSDAHNQSLSEQRAQSVAEALVAKGISRSRMKVAGYGKRRPVASNKTEEGRAQNRRVEIDILK